eukprot:scaffold121699_cov72-Phaeocystis_antarctica.AAC.2
MRTLALSPDRAARRAAMALVALSGGRSVVPQGGAAELQGAARGEEVRLVQRRPHRDRPDVAGHAGLGAASARESVPLQKLRRSRPRGLAAAGGGAGRGRAAGRDLSPDRRYAW